jgi:hypothetical protein
MRLTRRLRVLAFASALVAFSGCATFEHLAIFVGNVKSPIGIKIPRHCGPSLTNWCLGHYNNRLRDDERDVLEEAAQGLKRTGALDRTALAARICELPSRDPQHACDASNDRDRFDDYADLRAKKTLVLVALSGGGARAGMLAAHSMALLEDAYNREADSYVAAHPGAGEIAPFIDLIDAYSTVSGGSLFAYQVARWHLICDAAGGDNPRFLEKSRSSFCERRHAFRTILTGPGVTIGIQKLGAFAAAGYLSPFNLFLYPIETMLGDSSITEYLAAALEPSLWNLTGVGPGETMLAEVSKRPRFLFNSVILESGTPLVITQSLAQLPLSEPPHRTARIDFWPGDLFPVVTPDEHHAATLARPFRHSLTLEDLGTTPVSFPLASAAMASAAFPVGFEPIKVRKYHFLQSSHTFADTGLDLALVDGGVYDNSGLTTALDLADFLSQAYPMDRHLLLISINAEVTTYDVSVATGATPEAGVTRYSPVEVRWPVASLRTAVASLNEIHYLNKGRSEEAAGRRITNSIRGWPPAKDVDLFPINLTQLSERDLVPIKDGAPKFEAVRGTGTDFVVSEQENRGLESAASGIIDADQKQILVAELVRLWPPNAEHPDLGWKVGCGEQREFHLGVAFAASLLASQGFCP